MDQTSPRATDLQCSTVLIVGPRIGSDGEGSHARQLLPGRVQVTDQSSQRHWGELRAVDGLPQHETVEIGRREEELTRADDQLSP